MNKIKILISFFSCFISLVVVGQPGYMGKKIISGTGSNISPVTFGSNANNKSLFGGSGSSETGYFRVNLTQEGYIEYNANKNYMIGFATKYLRTGYDNQESISGVGRPTGSYVINAITYHPYMKFYTNQSVAPWGKYVIMGPTINTLYSKHDAYMHIKSTVNDHDTLLTNFGDEKQMKLTADFLIGSGRTRIFKDKYVVDYGFNFQLLSALTFFESLNGSVSGNTTQANYISSTIASRFRGANRFNFFFKIGRLF